MARWQARTEELLKHLEQWTADTRLDDIAFVQQKGREHVGERMVCLSAGYMSAKDPLAE